MIADCCPDGPVRLQRDLVAQLHMHPYRDTGNRDTLSGPGRVTALMKLKHVDQTRRPNTSIKHVDDQAND
ncbi:hypothetical protein [Streptomyces decoyicus]|uniref:hypothetical protein n=1 Tax=Streptomyces decoyicus TaxID=249567 RepID=UPI003664ABCE